MNLVQAFMIHTWILTKRSLIVLIRNPFTFIPNLFISLFFLLVYTGGLSGIAQLPQFEGADYLSFILPVSIVSAAVGGAGGAGQSLVRDLESGYFARLLQTPVTRLAIVLGPTIAGMLQLIVQTLIILGVAFLLGLKVEAGPGGVLVILLLTVGWGLAFAGYSVAIALKTKNAQAAQAGTLIFFPLIFLSTTFVPLELIEAQWLRAAAIINPTTYLFESMRAVLIDGWVMGPIISGFAVIGAVCAVTVAFSVRSATRAFKRE
ncbi:ABC transporter permease [Salipaludibacillus sp. CUR1]|uniref:ABC transporter permease n=1 Tax=Salipaludibacillus sp. CUR1 TaxID=2820003 RepID=UPI001E540E04|nr:ABC transporter permease [Salipaludibacillus sp. CUR1]MCE7793273.1 ABC transporter permease [Salipaludibacillus sp. CUR1]